MSSVVIFGGHGQISQLLIEILVTRGWDVTATIRKPEQEQRLREIGATPIVFDLESASEEEFDRVIHGCDAIVWSAGAGGGSRDRTYAVDRDAAIQSMRAAERTGVRRYVMVSFFTAGRQYPVSPDNSFFAYAEAKMQADEALQRSELEWTILGPSSLVSEDPTGKIEIGATLGSKNVTRSDVAAVAAACLERAETVSHFIRFNNGATPIENALTQAVS